MLWLLAFVASFGALLLMLDNRQLRRENRDLRAYKSAVGPLVDVVAGLTSCEDVQ